MRKWDLNLLPGCEQTTSDKNKPSLDKKANQKSRSTLYGDNKIVFIDNDSRRTRSKYT